MSFFRADAITLVQSYLRLGAGQELIFDNEIGDMLDNAVELHSEKFPREMRLDTIGNGESNYHLPGDWVDDLSVVMDIEYPTGEQVPNNIDRSTFAVIKTDTTARGVNSASSGATSITLTTAANAGYYKKGDPLTITNGTGASKVTQQNWTSADGNTSTGAVTLKNALSSALNSSPTVAKASHVRFLEDSPSSPNVFTLKYGIAHTLSDTSNTLPTNACKAFCHLTASLVAYAISAKFAQHQDSSFGADAVDYANKSELWKNVAEDQRKLYNDHFGIKEESEGGSGVPAAGVIADLDMKYGWGRKWLWHGGAFR